MLEFTQRFRQLNFAYKIFGAGFLCLLTTLGLASQLLSQSTLGKKPVHSRAGSAPRVTGTIAVASIAAPLTAKVGNHTAVELPDIPLALKEWASQSYVVVARTESALNGYFEFNAPESGRYAVCWDISGTEKCTEPFSVSDRDVRLRTILAPVSSARIMGSVLTGDRRPCWINDHFFNLNVSTTVTASPVGTSTVSRKARANTNGQFALINLAPGTYDVTATCEKATVSGQATVGQAKALRLNLGNHAPRIREISLHAPDNSRVRLKSPGAAVHAVADAVDPDNHAIEYIWRNNDGSNAKQGPSEKFDLQVPEHGIQSTYLIARNGWGGYAYRRYDLGATPKHVEFSGVILDETTNRPVEGAMVSVGDVTTKSGATGWFDLAVKPKEDSRYVLNIHRQGYALASRLYGDTNLGGTYDLIRTQVSALPASGAISIVDTQSSGPCGNNPEGRNQTTRVLAQPRLHQFDLATPAQDTKADAMGATKADAIDATKMLATQKTAKKCVPRGIKMTINQGALVNADGRPPDGNILASVATLDPTRRGLPGDYRAKAGDRRDVSLQSFGAVYAEFRDAKGNKLNLAPGQTATLHIPVPAGERAAAGKSDLKLWSYDEAQGLWLEEGVGKIEDAADGAYFAVDTKHFSVLNFDMLINPTDPNETCARLHVPPGALTGYTNITLRGYVTYNLNGTLVSQAHDAYSNIDPVNDEYNGIYWLPFGPTTAPNTLRLEVTATDSSANTVIILNDIVNIDQIPFPTANGQNAPTTATTFGGFHYWDDPTHHECGTAIELAPPSTDVPAYAMDATGRPIFLMGPFNVPSNPDGFNPDPAHFNPDTYYGAGGINAEATLGAWWNDHGFDQTGQAAGNPTYTRAGYLNDNDLGFGRDMNCLKENNGAGQNVACYVTNFGLPDQNPNNANLAEAHDPTKAAATVTMTYDASASGGANVQFYVYGGASPGSKLLKYADLDGFGPKPVPQLCTVCHGGRYNSGAQKVLNAHFREFDLPSFKYSNGRSWDYGAGSSPTTAGPNLTDAEFTNFARLNRIVHDGPSNQGQKDLIDAWYPGGFAGAPQPTTPAPTSAALAHWTNTNGYYNAYGKSCRTCHIARENIDLNSQTTIQPTTGIAFQDTGFRVCGLGRVMPNAVVTFKNFWLRDSGGRVAAYEAVTNTPSGTCKNN
jgi:hypothetical protein